MGGYMRSFSRLSVALGASLLLAACTATAESDSTSSESPSASESATSATPTPESGDAVIVAQMCDLMVAPDAPVPPAIEPNATGGPDTWSSFLVSIDEYFEVVGDEMEALADQSRSETVKDSYSSFLEAAVASSLSAFRVILAPSEVLTNSRSLGGVDRARNSRVLGGDQGTARQNVSPVGGN